MATPLRVAILVLIHGRVQGVWFRGWTEEQALARGLDGWVRNRVDGTVEAMLIERCRHGNRLSPRSLRGSRDPG
jgi:acylphosphatase